MFVLVEPRKKPGQRFPAFREVLVSSEPANNSGDVERAGKGFGPSMLGVNPV